MEQAFSLLYTAKDFPEIYGPSRGRKPTAGTRRELEDFLKLLFSILNYVESVSTQTGYDRLASRLERKDAIITLNYDTTLDAALRREGWNPRTGYCIGGSANKVTWPIQGPATNCRLRGLQLLKLHGSTNWWVRGTHATLQRVFSAKPVRISGPRSNEIGGHLRQIVPPIYGKVFAHEHWRKLWNQAFTALVNAEALVVVGCSIISTDFHLQALIRRVAKLRKRAGNSFRLAVLVDVARVRRRWRRVFRGLLPRLREYKKFERFLAEGLNL